VAPQPLPERMGAGQGVEFGDALGVPAAGQVGLDAVFERGEARFLQASRFGAGEGSVGHIGERGAPPQSEGCSQGRRRLFLLTGGGLFPGLFDQGLKADAVDVHRVDANDVAGRLGDDDSLATALPQRFPQPGDVDPQGVGRPLRRVFSPQVVGQGLGRHHPVGRQQQKGEDRPFAVAPDSDADASVADDLEGTENAELHPSTPLSDVLRDPAVTLSQRPCSMLLAEAWMNIDGGSVFS
jgi:hypothetical protein